MSGLGTNPIVCSSGSLMTNYARIGHAAQQVFPDILQDIIAAKEPQHCLYRDVTSNWYLSRTLRADEWSMINNVRTNGYVNFDIPLMYKLVRNLNLVPPPSKGWDFHTPPAANEILPGDDIERIRRTRNEILHRGNAQLSDCDLANYFTNFKAIAVRLEAYLGKPKGDFLHKFQDLENCCMDEITEKTYLENLNILRERDINLSKAVENIQKDLDSLLHKAAIISGKMDEKYQGYGCVGTPGSNITSSPASVLPEAYRLMNWCKILFFVGKLQNNNLPIMLECVDIQRVSDICEKREKFGYKFVSEWISKDFFFAPHKTIITVDVKGKFRISTESGVKHPRLTFIPVIRDNFTRFLVELNSDGIQYGVLVLRENGIILDEICYNPGTTKTRIGNLVNRGKNKSTAIVQPLIARNLIVRDFFTDKGLLALSKSMSPDTMLDVCINMDMTTSTFDTLQQEYGVGTTRGNIALWKTALDQQPHNKRVENLIKSLVASGQKSLADKVELLHSTGKDLHTI